MLGSKAKWNEGCRGKQGCWSVDLKIEIIQDYLDGPNVTTQVLKRGKGRQKRESEAEGAADRDHMDAT